MADASFNKPVLVRVEGTHGRSEVVELRTVCEALRAIHRDGLGGFRVDSLVWQRATDRLMVAERDGSPEAIEAARIALLALARQSRAPLDS